MSTLSGSSNEDQSFRLPIRRFNGKAAVLAVAHAVIFAAALFVAFFTRNDFRLGNEWLAVYAATVGGIVTIKLIVFYLLGHCHASWRRVSFGDLTGLLWATTLSMLVLVSIDSVLLRNGRVPAEGFEPVPRSVILLDWAATIMILGGLRAVWRSFREELRPLFSSKPARTALIVGANQAGELLARNLVANATEPYLIAGFLDDDRSLLGSRFAGSTVLGTTDKAGQLAARFNVDDVLVQSGVISGRRFRDLYDAVTEAGAMLKVMPQIDELLLDEGRSHVRVRPVEINDLLRREAIRLEESAIRELVEGRTVLITGAGGSIGSEICRQVLRFGPKMLLMVEKGENALFLIEQEFARREIVPPTEPLIADITDRPRMEKIFAEMRPEVVFHAAAHKHVPMMEHNPAEAIKNNVFGTRLLAQLADRYGVRQFVMISTDKAVHPTSVMGCSKLLAERFVQGLAAKSKTKFICVRFGNVLGSNGSVVPIFQEQIRLGGPITVTHPNIERYFMTIPEASQLVLQAATMGTGGEIFVLDMGESVRIVDLARDLVRLSGLAEDDIEIAFTGLRPGEKLYEELYFDEERRVRTRHEKVFCAMHRPADPAETAAIFDELETVLDAPPEVVRARLRDLVPEFGEANHASAAARAFQEKLIDEAAADETVAKPPIDAG